MILASAIKFHIEATDKNVILCGCRHGDVFMQLPALGFKPHEGYKEIEQGLQNNFMARILLRNPFYATIVSDASRHQIQISSYLESISESTRIRRIPSIRKMLNIIINACDVKEKVYYRLYNLLDFLSH